MRAMIRFGKQPRLRFISHLDLQRFFQRALNRTGLPIAWTQGFNPHPILSFGSALALGWTSEYEILDVKLSAPMGRRRTEDAMRAALPVDLPVLEVRMVDDRHPAPMAMVRASDYEITLSGETAAATLDAAEEFLRRESVMAMRKTKSGEREVDIRPMALSLEREGDVLSARLMLTEKDTLKPDLLVRALAEIAGAEVPEMRIHRRCLLGEDESGALKGVKTVRLDKSFKPIPGTEEDLDCELLLIAAGFLGPQRYVPEAFGLELTPRSCVRTPEGGYSTNVPKVFSAGDMRRGQSLVVWAIQEGRAAAREVDAFLMGYTN